MIDLTPLEVRKKKSDFRRVMRGYDTASVDDFLDLVADRLDELVRENASLSERARAQELQVAEFRERERALTEALVTAQEMREEIRRQTTREAELARQSAEQDASQLRARVEQEVSALRTAAEQEVAAMRAAAEQEAARLRTSAAEEATQVRSTAAQEAAQLRSKAQTETRQLRATAEREATELRTTVRQDREREEEALRQALARQQKFLASYVRFLESELAQVRTAAAAMGAAAASGFAPLAAASTDTAPAEAATETTGAATTGAATTGAETTAAEHAAAEPEFDELDEFDDVGETFTAGLYESGATEQIDAPDQTSADAERHPAGPMFPDDPIEDDELAFVDALEPFDAGGFEPLEPLEPFAPEPFEPEPYEPEPYEPEPYEAGFYQAEFYGSGAAESEPAQSEAETEHTDPERDAAGEGSPDAAPPTQELSIDAYGVTGAAYGGFAGSADPDEAGEPDAADGDDERFSAPAFDGASAWGDDAGQLAADAELELYDGLAAEPHVEGVPGPVGLGSLSEPPQGWATTLSWTIEGLDLIPDDAATAELPRLEDYGRREEAGGAAGTDRSGGRSGEAGSAAPDDFTAPQDTDGEAPRDSDADDTEADDEEASEILRNAEAAGYTLPELDDGDELLLDDEIGDADPADEDDGWLPTLLEDDKR